MSQTPALGRAPGFNAMTVLQTLIAAGMAACLATLLATKQDVAVIHAQLEDMTEKDQAVAVELAARGIWMDETRERIVRLETLTHDLRGEHP